MIHLWMQIIGGLALGVQLCSQSQKNRQMFPLVTNLSTSTIWKLMNAKKKCHADQHGLADHFTHLCFDVVLNGDGGYILSTTLCWNISKQGLC